jgi:hypothetical protein
VLPSMPVQMLTCGGMACWNRSQKSAIETRSFTGSTHQQSDRIFSGVHQPTEIQTEYEKKEQVWV